MSLAAQPSEGGWQAAFLLPVPLDSSAKSLVLKVRTHDGQQAEARVVLFDKKRPVQALRVDKNMWIHRQRCRSVSAGIGKRPARLWTTTARNVCGRLLLRGPCRGVSSRFGLRRVFNDQPRGCIAGSTCAVRKGRPSWPAPTAGSCWPTICIFPAMPYILTTGRECSLPTCTCPVSFVRPGDVVRRGQVIGKDWVHGRVTGPHLHLSSIVLGQAVDPEPLLEDRPAARR